jgi:hypothetical protein
MSTSVSRATRKVDGKSRVVLPVRFTGRTVIVETIADDEVRIRLAKAPRMRPTFGQLMAKVTAKNLHSPVEFGPPVGSEAI